MEDYYRRVEKLKELIDDGIVIVATGPLTSDLLSKEIMDLIKEKAQLDGEPIITNYILYIISCI